MDALKRGSIVVFVCTKEALLAHKSYLLLGLLQVLGARKVPGLASVMSHLIQLHQFLTVGHRVCQQGMWHSLAIWQSHMQQPYSREHLWRPPMPGCNQWQQSKG